MATVNVQDAKTRLSELLARVERGEEIVVARAGKPVARLVAVDLAWTRPFGRIPAHIPDDFDAPLDEAELAAWE
ncbi:MAG TPA: type II toxin-antitoxin system prevent-host-death family antitoxin [Propionicimonas sp.]|nr:type II toxin-antitoxin system prevent-host-death family antitoxin [Propionicimonas sp.]